MVEVLSALHDLSTCRTFLNAPLSARRLRRSLFGCCHFPAPAFLGHFDRPPFLPFLPTIQLSRFRRDLIVGKNMRECASAGPVRAPSHQFRAVAGYDRPDPLRNRKASAPSCDRMEFL